MYPFGIGNKNSPLPTGIKLNDLEKLEQFHVARRRKKGDSRREKPFDLIDNERIRLSTKGPEWALQWANVFFRLLWTHHKGHFQVLHVKVWFKRSNGVQSVLV
ncbi:hypothetical protein CEXT_10541 [Caerostris extrusa]|uniref:Uncharacterized protein n=1 Tax=Caerostris extrusa TaxID=172846 RepID=A0AAV4UZD1_CAEEX|nr:hypothetical protein CEXT_10541 [Caerostris extrusa]